MRAYSMSEQDSHIPLDRRTFLRWLSRWWRGQHETGSPSFSIIPLARSVDFERYDFRVGGLSGRTVEIVSMERYRRHRTRSHCNRARVVAQRCDELAARFFRDIMRVADTRENKMALVPSKFRDPNPSGAKMLARVRVVIGVSRLG